MRLLTKIRNYLYRKHDYADYLRIEYPQDYERMCFEPKNSPEIVRLWGAR